MLSRIGATSGITQQELADAQRALLHLLRKLDFDDPFTYHFYYGDEGGHPGTLVTLVRAATPWLRTAAWA